MSDSYIVSLPMQVEADSPEDAVEEFMEQVLSFGLRGWNFNLFKLNDEGGVEEQITVMGASGEVVSHGDAEDEPAPSEPEPSDEGGTPASEGGDS